VNGSGKHNNYSLSTDGGSNLLEPGQTPSQNARFIIFLTALIRAVDIHADLVRAAVANPGNEHRLGANEAPPAIISIYLGEQLDHVVRDIIGIVPSHVPAGVPDHEHVMKLGVNTIPPLPRDATDRNRTSPFAFTGNKFEFRAVGSSQVVAFPNIVLNTIVADSVKFLRTSIEQGMSKGGTTFQDAMQDIVRQTLEKHYRVVFNGDNYSEEWKQEAKGRGLLNLRTTPEALKILTDEKNLKLFEELHVLTRPELESRQHIMCEFYNKTIAIEAKAMHSLATTSILPTAMQYQKRVADVVASVASLLPPEAISQQKEHLQEVVATVEQLLGCSHALKKSIDGIDGSDEYHLASYHADKVIPKMAEVRACCDKLETIVDDDLWPLPKYSEILFIR